MASELLEEPKESKNEGDFETGVFIEETPEPAADLGITTIETKEEDEPEFSICKVATLFSRKKLKDEILDRITASCSQPKLGICET